MLSFDLTAGFAKAQVLYASAPKPETEYLSNEEKASGLIPAPKTDAKGNPLATYPVVVVSPGGADFIDITAPLIEVPENPTETILYQLGNITGEPYSKSADYGKSSGRIRYKAESIKLLGGQPSKTA